MGGELINLAIIKQDGQLLVGSRDMIRHKEEIKNVDGL